MKKFNWAEVTTPGTSLPAGAYVIEIQDVIDNEEWEQVEIVYNIIEGQYKDIYKNLPQEDEWKHKFNQKYTERARGFFKLFLDELEHDNPKFSTERWQIESDPLQFVGLKMGVLFGEYRYIYEGKAKYRLQAVRPLSIDKVKKGEWDVPEPTYKRGTDPDEWLELRADGTNTASAGATTDGFYDDTPF